MNSKRARNEYSSSNESDNSDNSDNEFAIKRRKHDDKHVLKKKKTISNDPSSSESETESDDSELSICVPKTLKNQKSIDTVSASDNSDSETPSEASDHSIVEPKMSKQKKRSLEVDSSSSESESEIGQSHSTANKPKTAGLKFKKAREDSRTNDISDSETRDSEIENESEMSQTESSASEPQTSGPKTLVYDSDDYGSAESDTSTLHNRFSDEDLIDNEITRYGVHLFRTRVSTKVSKQALKKFKSRLETYMSEIAKLRENMEHVSGTDVAYESSTELRRRAQLKTEETIADLKVLNGYDINDDESVLSAELQSQIESIYKTSEALIQKTDNYEQSLISETDSAETKTKVKEIIAELDAKKQIADKWAKVLEKTAISQKKDLDKAREEMNKFNLKLINEKISMLPINAKKLDFVENNEEVGKENGQRIGKMQLKETIPIEKLTVFKFRDFEQGPFRFTMPSRVFEPMKNGMYIVGGYVAVTKKFHLCIYDPVKNMRIKETTFDSRVDTVFACDDKIVISQRKGKDTDTINSILKTLDGDLNVIKEKPIISTHVQSVSGSHIYCTRGFYELTLIMFDWDLNETKTETAVVFQQSDPTKSFYLRPAINNYRRLEHDTNHVNVKIVQLEKCDDKYILNLKSSHYSGSNIVILSEAGAILKKMATNDSFVIDSKKNIIVSNSNSNTLTYYDLNGESFKTVTLKRPKLDTIKLKHFKIDSADRIYFTQ